MIGWALHFERNSRRHFLNAFRSEIQKASWASRRFLGAAERLFLATLTGCSCPHAQREGTASSLTGACGAGGQARLETGLWTVTAVRQKYLRIVGNTFRRARRTRSQSSETEACGVGGQMSTDTLERETLRISPTKSLPSISADKPC